MAIPVADIKLLWGRAAGFCSRMGCTADLTRLIDQADPYTIGEMAHVIARSKDGPRGNNEPGPDSYANLILLCPTCHRDVDKAPSGVFTEEILRDWKTSHETRVRTLGSGIRYENAAEMKSAVARLLAENRAIWETLGPRSMIAQTSPSSNAHSLWLMRRIDKIIPNNRFIINLIRNNQNFMSPEEGAAFAYFVNHAESYEDHVYDRRDYYPQFPMRFQELFG